MSSESSEASLEESILFWRSFLSQSDLSTNDRLAASINLANALSDLADESGDSVQCDEAVDLGSKALQLAPESGEPRLTVLSDLSTIHLTRFELKGDRRDLEISQRLIKASAGETPADHPSKYARYANLANILCTAFDNFGRVDDLEDAIKASQQVDQSPDVDSDTKAKALSNKGRALGMRYDRYQIFTDLEEAIRVTEDAYRLAKDPSTKAACGMTLVGHLISLAERDRSDGTLNRAVQEGQKLYTALEGPHQAMLAHNLSYLLRLKYERVDQDGDQADLQAALDYAEIAISLPGEETNLAMYRDNLAICLEHAHRISPSEKFLELAIGQARDAVSLLPHDHLAAASYSNRLADLLKVRNGEGDIQEALSISKSVFTKDRAPLLVRIAAGQQCGFMQAGLGKWQEASKTFEMAVDLIQDLARNSLQRRDQQHVLSQLTGLSQSAASAALEAGRRPAEAFSILERGRGVLAELAITSKSRFAPGLEVVPDAQPLLERYQEIKATLAGQMPTALSLGSNQLSSTAITSIRLQALQEVRGLEDEMTTIANRLGLDVLTRPDKDITGALHEDFAVAFNTTKYRCDAFIITSKVVESIRLPLLNVEELARYVRYLLGPGRVTKIRNATYRRSNEQLQEILIWLWRVAVQPVLSHLGLAKPQHPNSRLPRVCWITSGAMGLMPLHAAGHHSPTSEDFTMNYIVSSYVVSSRALSWCRKRFGAKISADTPQELQAVAITMPMTPGFSPLDLVKDELQALQAAIPHAYELRAPSATQAQTLLQSLNVAHFACHAEPGADDPSSGCVLLYDKYKNAVDRLSVYQISQIDTSSAWLAYLSACQTADLQDLDFLDEIIHIAGAFQIAGFPQVVGTLWQAEDEYAANVAKEFYSNSALRAMLRGQQPLQHETAVVALHEAVNKVRDEDPEMVLSWAQFVIFGA